MKIVGGQGATRVVAYRGDARTLLAFDLLTETSHANLAGFTIQIAPPGSTPSGPFSSNYWVPRASS